MSNNKKRKMAAMRFNQKTLERAALVSEQLEITKTDIFEAGALRIMDEIHPQSKGITDDK